MAQAAFLLALAGVEIAEVAAQAAVTSLSKVDNGAEAEIASNGDTTWNVLGRTSRDANSLIEKEELDVEKAISKIVEVQMKEILEKIGHFEKLDLQMDREWKQLEQMKHMLFVDQFSHLFYKTSAPKTRDQKCGERQNKCFMTTCMFYFNQMKNLFLFVASMPAFYFLMGICGDYYSRLNLVLLAVDRTLP